VAVLAVGGYGRAEMAPHSDVDLLFLTPWKITPWAESVIESMLYMLWDLRLKVGHASRTVKDCLRLAREDMTIRTALLEYRFIAGTSRPGRRAGRRLWSRAVPQHRPRIHRGQAGRARRPPPQAGRQRYVLEPNVKEGKGGLRDLQTLYWIGKYLHRVEDRRGSGRGGAVPPEEYETFRDAENFLWAVRCHCITSPAARPTS
jgi:[protein-PII] uridylyltransferase